MDTQTLFNVAVTLAGGLGGWVLNNIWQSIRTLDKDVRQMPHLYVTKEDYKSDISEIKQMLGKIFDKLDEKADK
jgi:hypothetical protein